MQIIEMGRSELNISSTKCKIFVSVGRAINMEFRFPRLGVPPEFSDVFIRDVTNSLGVLTHSNHYYDFRFLHLPKLFGHSLGNDP